MSNQLLCHTKSHYTLLHNSPLRFATIHCILCIPYLQIRIDHFQPIKDCVLHHIKCHSTPFYNILFHSTTFHYVLLHSITSNKAPFFSKPWRTLYSITLHMILVPSAALHSIPEHFTMFYWVPFHDKELHFLPDYSETLYCGTLYAILNQ